MITALHFSLLPIALAMPNVSRAQSSPDTTAVSDDWARSVAAWGSVGVGGGNPTDRTGGSIALVARGNVSAGPWLLTYRASDVGPFISAGSGVRDGAILAGVRSGGHRVFASAAAGYSRASAYHQSDNSGPDTAPTVTALAYEVSLHANAYVPGVALYMFGDVGPGKSSYSAFTVSLEFGWFGL